VDEAVWNILRLKKNGLHLAQPGVEQRLKESEIFHRLARLRHEARQVGGGIDPGNFLIELRARGLEFYIVETEKGFDADVMIGPRALAEGKVAV